MHQHFKGYLVNLCHWTPFKFHREDLPNKQRYRKVVIQKWAISQKQHVCTAWLTLSFSQNRPPTVCVKLGVNGRNSVYSNAVSLQFLRTHLLLICMNASFIRHQFVSFLMVQCVCELVSSSGGVADCTRLNGPPVISNHVHACRSPVSVEKDLLPLCI